MKRLMNPNCPLPAVAASVHYATRTERATIVTSCRRRGRGFAHAARARRRCTVRKSARKQIGRIIGTLRLDNQLLLGLVAGSQG